MPFIVEQRKPTSKLNMFRNWSECAGSKVAEAADTGSTLDWWAAYDKYYSIEGWDYRIREVKK